MINTYISDLLYRYECVIVPELGAFLAQQKPAAINTSTYVFLPPRKEITFNEQLQQNDGLLANYIATSKNCSYAEALIKINEFVQHTKGKLIAGETVLIPKTGYFSLNLEGKLQFEAINEINYLTTSFGLSETIKKPVSRNIYKEKTLVLEEKKPITIVSKTIEKQKKRPYLQYAAIALIGLGMFGFFAKNYVATKQLEIITDNKKVNLEATKIAYQKATFFDAAPITIPAATLSITVIKNNVGKYHIIAGAFRFEENADRKVKQLKNKGFYAQKIAVNKYGLHQIAYASYENRLEALKALRIIKKTNNKAAWLLVKKLN